MFFRPAPKNPGGWAAESGDRFLVGRFGRGKGKVFQNVLTQFLSYFLPKRWWERGAGVRPPWHLWAAWICRWQIPALEPQRAACVPASPAVCLVQCRVLSHCLWAEGLGRLPGDAGLWVGVSTSEGAPHTPATRLLASLRPDVGSLPEGQLEAPVSRRFGDSPVPLSGPPACWGFLPRALWVLSALVQG